MRRPEPFRLVPITEIRDLKEGDRIVHMPQAAEVRFRSDEEVLVALNKFARTVRLVTGINDFFQPCLGIQVGGSFIAASALNSSEYFVVTGGGSRFSAWHVDDSQDVTIPFPPTTADDGASRFDPTPNPVHTSVTGRSNAFAVAEAQLDANLYRHFKQWAREDAERRRADALRQSQAALRSFAYRTLSLKGVVCRADEEGFRLFFPPDHEPNVARRIRDWFRLLGLAGIIDDETSIAELVDNYDNLAMTENVAESETLIIDKDAVVLLIDEVLHFFTHERPALFTAHKDRLTTIKDFINGGGGCVFRANATRQGRGKADLKIEFELF